MSIKKQRSKSKKQKLNKDQIKKQEDIVLPTNVYTLSEAEAVMNIIHEKYKDFHGQHFPLKKILEDLFLEYKAENVDVKIFSALLHKFLIERKKYYGNVFIRRENDDTYNLHVITPKEKIFKVGWKFLILIIPLIIFEAIFAIFLNPDFIDEYIPTVKFNMLFFFIFMFIYLWMIFFNKLYISIISIYGFLYVILKVFHENDGIFYPYNKYLDFNIAIISFIIIFFILFSVKVININYFLKICINNIKLFMKKSLNSDYITNYYKNENIIMNNRLVHKQKWSNFIENIFSTIFIEKFVFKIKVNLNKTLNSDIFMLVGFLASLAYLTFLYFGPVNEDYFKKNNTECNLIDQNLKISRLQDDNLMVLVIRTNELLDGNLIHTYDKNKLIIKDTRINSFQDIVNYDKNLTRNWPFGIESKKQYIYKEQCNKIK